MKPSALCKLCRREGEKLFLKGEKCLSAKCPLIRRNYPPGQKGRFSKKLSDYAKQLREKQKAKRVYGLRENQFKNYYKKAAKATGDTGELLLCFLERRLDNVVYKLGLAKSRNQARQFISHRRILINGKKVNIPSYLVQYNDKIEPAVGLKNKLDKKTTIPGWLKINQSKQQAAVLKLPKKEDLESGLGIAQIIEFYSK